MFTKAKVLGTMLHKVQLCGPLPFLEADVLVKIFALDGNGRNRFSITYDVTMTKKNISNFVSSVCSFSALHFSSC